MYIPQRAVTLSIVTYATVIINLRSVFSFTQFTLAFMAFTSHNHLLVIGQ